jgi:hypothetical protein
MTMTVKVGKIEITSDKATNNAEFVALIDQLLTRIKALGVYAAMLEPTAQPVPSALAVAPTAAAVAPTVTTVQTV